MMKANIQSSTPVLTAHQTLLVVFLTYQRKAQCILLYIGLFFPKFFLALFTPENSFAKNGTGTNVF